MNVAPNLAVRFAHSAASLYADFMALLRGPPKPDLAIATEHVWRATDAAGWAGVTGEVISRALRLACKRQGLAQDDAMRWVWAVAQMIAMGRLDIHEVRVMHGINGGAHELARACDYASVATFMHDVDGGKIKSDEAMWARYAAILLLMGEEP